MKEKFRKNIVPALQLVAGILMGIQITIGFVWMAKNITVIPTFGDSQEYLNLSQTLALDEYRPILYPLILRWIQRVCKTDYQILLYLFQTVISFFSVFYGVHTVFEVTGKNKRSEKAIGRKVFFSLYLMTIPMITFMNFCVLTDSLATSMLMLFLSGCILVYAKERPPVKTYILMTAALLVECLLRADRLYSCLILAVTVFLVRLIRKQKNRRQLMVAMFSVCLSVVAVVKTVDHFTQIPGLNGRIQTNFEFVLLDRIVWPNMAANYSSFPEEIRDIIPLEDARTFDSHNNNVMYQMAPLMEEKAGKEKAREMYGEMAKIVFSNQTKKVLFDIGEDILAMAATPFSSMLNAHKLCKKGDSWNIHCMSSKEPDLTKYYNYYYQYAFLGLLVLGIFITVLKRMMHQSTGIRKSFAVLLPYIGMSMILTLWFSLGDGAPPNDRYAMIIYITWSLLGASLWGMWNRT